MRREAPSAIASERPSHPGDEAHYVGASWPDSLPNRALEWRVTDQKEANLSEQDTTLNEEEIRTEPTSEVAEPEEGDSDGMDSTDTDSTDSDTDSTDSDSDSSDA